MDSLAQVIRETTCSSRTTEDLTLPDERWVNKEGQFRGWGRFPGTKGRMLPGELSGCPEAEEALSWEAVATVRPFVHSVGLPL